jgi:cyanate permease
MMALGVGGLIIHLNPMFQDMGMTAMEAAQITSLIGIASSVGRLLIGVCLDRFPATLVSVTVLAAGLLGIGLIWLSGASFAVVAVLLIGLLLGAELDLLAYLASRLFGQRSFGTLYGWLYSLYSLGFGFSPLLLGKLRDHFGNYDAALLGCMVFLSLAAAVVLGLNPSQTEKDATA